MALPHAILVSLSEQSGSGYELAHRFDRSIGFFWSATHQQIYRTLRTMEDDGWVHVTPVVQQGRPDKKVYTVADAGRAELSPLDRRALDRPRQFGHRQPHPRPGRQDPRSRLRRHRRTARPGQCASGRTRRAARHLPRVREAAVPRPERAAAAAPCISTWCCAAASGPKRVPWNGSTKSQQGWKAARDERSREEQRTS